MKLLPGDPFIEDRPLSFSEKKEINKHFGFDQPLFSQYLAYLKKTASGDLGTSLVYRNLKVSTILKEGFLVSALLGCEALLFAFSFGVTLATLTALFPSKRNDFFFLAFLIVGLSLPSFVLATLLQYVLAYKLSLFPLARLSSFSHTILPAFSLSIFPLVTIARHFKRALEALLEEDYILTAKAKGLSSFALFKGHLLKNTLLPIIPLLPPLLINTLIGSFVIEQIFAIPGLGVWLISSVQNRDYPVILGTTLFYTSLFLTLTLFFDIIKALLDKRERVFL
jgi:oligopeptide transport system permease protein